MNQTFSTVIMSLFLTFGLLSSHAQGTVIKFSNRQDLVRQVSSEKFTRMTAPIKLKVWEPHENQEVIYEGYLLTDVLNFIYGDAWKKMDLVLFVCSDGYRATVPRVNIEAEKSILAFRKLDLNGHPLNFVLNNIEQHEKNVDLGPFYLVWNNEHNAEVKADGGTNWPYQIIAVELWDYKDLFKKSLPSPSASHKIHQGFALFQKFCSSCHQVNGEGGEKGSELISTQIIHNLSDNWLKRWIDDPARIKPDTQMPPLNKNLKNRDDAIDDIILYLKSMDSSV